MTDNEQILIEDRELFTISQAKKSDAKVTEDIV